jgi:hypothetical protein
MQENSCMEMNAVAGGSSCVTAMKAHAHAVAGDKASAREILRELRRTPNHKCMPSYDIAATYAALGDSSQSVSWLKRACSEHNMKLFKLRQDPRFDLASTSSRVPRGDGEHRAGPLWWA